MRLHLARGRTLPQPAATTFAAMVVGLAVFLAGSAPAQCYDFSDSTLQGWSEGDPFGNGFNGILDVPVAGGNPGPYMRATDTVAQGGGLFAAAPPSVSGSLANFEIRWDELLPVDNLTVASTHVLLEGTNGSLYRSDQTLQTPGVWTPRSLDLSDSTGWVLLQGTDSYASVVSDVAVLYINLDVVQRTDLEACVDNICLVEDPTPVERATWGAVKRTYGP